MKTKFHKTDFSKTPKATEEKYRVLFESSHDAIMTLEPPEWNFTSWNKSFLRIFDIPQESQAEEYSPLILSPEKQTDGQLSSIKAKKMIETALKEGSNFFEWRHKKESGKEFYSTVLLSKITIGGEDILQATVRDISERKMAEQELLESERKYRSIIENMVDGYYRTDLAGKMILASPSAFRMFGVKLLEDIVGLDVAENFYADPSKRKDFIKALQENNGRIRNYEMELKNKKGEIIPSLTNSNFYFDSQGNVAGIEGIFSDISERKQMEAEIERFKIISENANYGQAIVNLQGVVVYINRYFAEIHGYTQEELVGKKISIFHTKEQLPHVKQINRLAFEKGQYDSQEVLHLHKNGKEFPMLMNGIVLYDKDKNPEYLAATAINITIQKEAEKRLTIEKEKALAASKAKSEFLANMSHEIRTPLNGIIGFTDLMKKTPLSTLQKQYIDNANSSAHSLLGIINDILDFSKIEANRLELEIIPVDIITLLEESVDIVKFHASEKRIELLLNIPPDIPRFASVDPLRLKQIFSNLLGNAVKFTQKGEVELKVAFRKLDSKNGVFTFSIRDTGIGISKEQQNKLFKSFSQADSSTTRKYGGTGLGLVISDMIAKKMGGEIRVDSEEEKGSTFYFDIATLFEHGKKKNQSAIKNVNRVLVIDDNKNNRMILEHMLHYWKIEVTGCEDGVVALETIKTSDPFDVIIVDYHMPHLNGIETIKRIRNELAYPQEKQPAILLHSSSESPALHEECDTLGIRFKLVKPVKSQELFDYLSNIYTERSSDRDVTSNNNDEKKEQINNNNITILVAEDNDINMILMKTLLSQMVPTATVIEAHNGIDALAKAKMVTPNLILMDIQMPEMDGIEATKRIREFSENIPIIAVTAGILSEKKKECLDSGMNDFLYKPIEVDRLHRILKKFLSPRSVTHSKIIKNDATLHFDKTSFLQKINHDKNFFKEVIEIARLTIPQTIRQLDKAINEQNRDEIQKSAHKIKGSVSNICFNQLAELAKTVEKECVAGNYEQLTELFEKIQKEWEEVLSLLD